MNRQSLMVGIGGIVIGTGLGYIIAERRLSARFEERLKNETAGMREFYTQHQQKFSTPEEAVQELVLQREVELELETQRNGDQTVAYHKIVKREYPTGSDIEGETVAEEFEQVAEQRNIFEPTRDPEKPYVISQQEFMQGDSGYIQTTLTFYEQDRALADERDELITELTNTVGDNFWHHFGSGSNDNNTLHIRNERLQMDFEIVRSEGSFAKEVLGMDENPPEKNRPSARQRRGE